MSGPKPQPIVDRFWSKVAVGQPEECWLWNGKRNAKGYGVLSVGSRTDQTRGYVIASRLSFKLAHGEPPDGADICHRCDNPPCVNPAHLFAGTHKQNMEDAKAKGRVRKPNPARTHCRKGHELTPENTVMERHLRLCRECQNARQRESYWRRK